MSFTTRPELQGSFGMVASTHWLGSAAGMAMLERGGNAFDAAAAAGFVLQVVEPHLCGPLGDLPILVCTGEPEAVRVICGQGPAPAAATAAAFRALGLDMVPGTGLLAPCVPGAFGAWVRLLTEFGTLRLRDVLEPALGYAESGWPVLARIEQSVRAVEGLFRDHWPSSAETWLAGGGPVAGSTWRSPALAATYRRVLSEAEAGGGGREAELERALAAWYEGFVAEAIDAFAPRAELMDSSGTPHRGLLAGSDLHGWRATVEEPVSAAYRDRYQVFKCGPWSQGPVFLQQLGLLEGFDLEALRPGSAEFIHVAVECAKLAFADREAWYGDPAFSEIPLAGLLAAAYAGARRGLVGEMASAELRPGRPGDRHPAIPWAEEIGSGPVAGVGDPTLGPLGQVRGDTVHVDAADRWGNLVSATPSGGWLQSSPVVPGLGFPLGTRAQLFNLAEGHPNCIGPGRRPRTTLSPSIAFRDGRPWIAFGTPGADQQDQWTLNWFAMLTAGKMNLQEAIDAPMWHTDHFPRSFHPHDRSPRSLVIEDRAGAGVVAELRRRGHEVTVADPWSLGRISATGREPGRGLVAAANPRGMQGYAAGR